MESRRRVVLITTLFLLAALPLTVSADSDNDGISDATDDCIWAAGTSSTDKTGCPDRDGDGVSNLNDPWTTPNPNFETEQIINSNENYNDIEYSGNGYSVVTGSDDNYIRIWNSSTFVNLRSANMGSDVHSVAFSPDSNYVAAGVDDDTVHIFDAISMNNLYGAIDVNVGSNERIYDLEFSPDSNLLAVSIARDNTNFATNGIVTFIEVTTGNFFSSGINPGGEDRFYDTAFSPDGNFIAVGSEGDWYISEISTGNVVETVTSPPDSVNAIAWSPDGNYIVMCGAYESNGARVQVHAYDGSSWPIIWEVPTSTSCSSADFSPDGSKFVVGMYWFEADGATAKIYQTTTGLLVDAFSGPRPNNCAGNNIQCGQIDGVSWHPDGSKIVTSHTRNDEGVYFWLADIDEDNDGYNTTDQGDGVVDAFPTDGTQWDDADGDGFGDNPDPATTPDSCINQFGTSTQDRFGCPDSDGDGWSDDGDWAPNNPEQWQDSDGDGYGDEYYYEVVNSFYHINQRGDAFPNNPTQWNDSDSDGWGDNYANQSWEPNRESTWPGILIETATNVDQFPLNHNQWLDTDGDWWGDNQIGDDADACPYVFGNSTVDRYGCVDTDGDGYSDPTANWGIVSSTGYCQADGVPLDPTQWCDGDGDGYGENQDGNLPDECPDEAGSSILDRVGCLDSDGDGYSDQGDPFPNDNTQWENRDGDSLECGGDNQSGLNPDVFPDDPTQCKDTDGDGYGDNAAGNNGDAFKFDPTQWSDFDGDGYGDNNGTGSINGDICPTQAGNSANPISRGCPDSDGDGFVDPEDAFPQNPLQWSDIDGDGYGDEVDKPGGDDCPQLFGTSKENNRYGCEDSDGDGWADVDDEFPNDGEQWQDTDGDGYGDNYLWSITFVEDLANDQRILELREQRGDAFPSTPDEWSDQDGDGYGDNKSDDFPLEKTQWSDFDGDGFGDNFTSGAYQPDDCKNEFGTSYRDVFGCLDSDNDGTSDTSDPCPYDPDVFEGRIGSVVCEITKPQTESDGDAGATSSSGQPTLVYLGIAIVALLSIIIVAQVSKTLAKKKSRQEKLDEAMVNSAFSEEDERRTAWIDYYIANGQLEEARALGWAGDDTKELPQWKQFEIQQQQEQDAAIPTMVNLDDIL